jgi:hypothetical protein
VGRAVLSARRTRAVLSAPWSGVGRAVHSPLAAPFRLPTRPPLARAASAVAAAWQAPGALGPDAGAFPA